MVLVSSSLLFYDSGRPGRPQLFYKKKKEPGGIEGPLYLGKAPQGSAQFQRRREMNRTDFLKQ